MVTPKSPVSHFQTIPESSEASKPAATISARKDDEPIAEPQKPLEVHILWALTAHYDPHDTHHSPDGSLWSFFAIAMQNREHDRIVTTFDEVVATLLEDNYYKWEGFATVDEAQHFLDEDTFSPMQHEAQQATKGQVTNGIQFGMSAETPVTPFAPTSGTSATFPQGSSWSLPQFYPPQVPPSHGNHYFPPPPSPSGRHHADGTQPFQYLPYLVVPPEKLKLEFPTTFDGTMEGFHEFKVSVELECTAKKVPHLTTDERTRDDTRDDSLLFANALMKALPTSAKSDFIGEDRLVYTTDGVAMWRRLLSTFQPTSPSAILRTINQWSMLSQSSNETWKAYKLRFDRIVETLRLAKAAPNDMLNLHVLIQGLDESRYATLKDGIRIGTMVIRSISKLGETVENIEGHLPSPPSGRIGRPGSSLCLGANSIDANASARRLTTDDDTRDSAEDARITSLLAKRDKSDDEVEQLKRMFKCPLHGTNAHPFLRCPCLRNYEIRKKPRERTRRDPEDSRQPPTRRQRDEDTDNNRTRALARRAEAATNQDSPPPTNAVETELTSEGKSPMLDSPLVSSPVLNESDSHTSPSNSTQVENDLDICVQDEDEFHLEIEDTVKLDAVTRDAPSSGLSSNSETVCHDSSSFINDHCMGRVALTSSRLDALHTGSICVDSGSTSHMWHNKDDFIQYRSLPQGSHVLLAENTKTACLGVGRVVFRSSNKVISLMEVFHVPALRSPLLSV